MTDDVKRFMDVVHDYAKTAMDDPELDEFERIGIASMSWFALGITALQMYPDRTCELLTKLLEKALDDAPEERDIVELIFGEGEDV